MVVAVTRGLTAVFATAFFNAVALIVVAVMAVTLEIKAVTGDLPTTVLAIYFVWRAKQVTRRVVYKLFWLRAADLYQAINLIVVILGTAAQLIVDLADLPCCAVVVTAFVQWLLMIVGGTGFYQGLLLQSSLWIKALSLL